MHVCHPQTLKDYTLPEEGCCPGLLLDGRRGQAGGSGGLCSPLGSCLMAPARLGAKIRGTPLPETKDRSRVGGRR